MTICIFGDSITWGAFDFEKGGWVERLKTYLINDDVYVYNLGVSNDSTENIIKRFDAEAEARNPDIIIFSVGTNDALKADGKNLISIDEFIKNIETLTDKARKITNKIVFIGLTTVDESKTNPYSWDESLSSDNQTVGEYDEAIRVFCEENDIIFIDMLGLLNKNEDLCDGLHPSATGHQKMFEVIKDAIEPLWKE
ncbi:MAG: GDSL-type esterase/lipase family protein [Candidatus Paceibacterota bacterium]|jgi:lysophospholipase L1-like esterase